MRRDAQRLRDVLEALESISRILGNRTETDFLGDETVRYAVAQRLTVIGEAAARLSPQIRQRHASVPWPDIIAFRNFLVLEYFGIHWPSVWVTATEQAPRLLIRFIEMLRQEEDLT